VLTRRTLLVVAALGSLVCAGALSAQDFTVERIFTAPELNAHTLGPSRWLASGDAYTAVEPSADVPGGQDIIRYDAASGARTVYVSAHQLTPPGTAHPLAVEEYSWSPDGRRLLLFTNSKKVWRDNTRGDYWLLDRSSGSLRQLGGPDAPPSSLMFAKFSPDGQRVAYVRQSDLYVEDVGAADGSAAPLRLTTDGSRTLINGTSDWVYEEEFKTRDCFRWSPDGTKIAYWQFDVTGVRDFLLIDDTDSLYSFGKPVQYPKAGTTNSAVRAGVVPSTGGPTVWLQVPDDPRNTYLPRLDWAANSTELLVQHVNRLQNTDQLMLANATTGVVRTIMTEHDSAWVDVPEEIRWVRKGAAFLWESERDGWRHVYEVARDGCSITLVTRGAFDVIAEGPVVESKGQGGGWLYFFASPTNATQRYLYRTRLDGHGEPERLTPMSQPGTHGYVVSPDGSWALHTYSTFDTPPVTDVVRLPQHAVARTLVRNDSLANAAAPLLAKRTEFFQVTLDDGATLDGWMIRPRDFDSTKAYPILDHVYGEPAAQNVLDAWGGRRALWHRWLADQGYLVISVDNRGTPAPKGRAWRKVIYGAVGELSSAEQAAAVRALGRTRRYVDTTRVAVWGWSGGGSNTLNTMFRYPDVFKVGMAVAPVPDERLYDTIYQERYMGLPDQNADGYRRGSPISFAEGLKGKLLIVHGTGDDNVHFQGTERLVNRLVALDKPFDLMVYPNRTHAINEGPGTTEHLYSLLTRYLVTNLPAGGR
jgi:dipeptidyl-peptidase-4